MTRALWWERDGVWHCVHGTRIDGGMTSGVNACRPATNHRHVAPAIHASELPAHAEVCPDCGRYVDWLRDAVTVAAADLAGLERALAPNPDPLPFP